MDLKGHDLTSGGKLKQINPILKGAVSKRTKSQNFTDVFPSKALQQKGRAWTKGLFNDFKSYLTDNGFTEEQTNQIFNTLKSFKKER